MLVFIYYKAYFDPMRPHSAGVVGALPLSVRSPGVVGHAERKSPYAAS